MCYAFKFLAPGKKKFSKIFPTYCVMSTGKYHETVSEMYSKNPEFIIDILDYIILDIVRMDTIQETPEDAIIQQPELVQCFK